MSVVHTLTRIQTIPRPIEEVFAFFAEARNLETITPPFLHFHVLTPAPIEMRSGALIDYRLRLRGLPIRWRTRIEEWRPNERFVDTQLRGPYALWHHTHLFRQTPAGVEMTDLVRYALPLGPLGAIAHRLFVRRDVENIFDYRAKTIARLFGAEYPARSAPGAAAA